jgi:hypothetical protein
MSQGYAIELYFDPTLENQVLTGTCSLVTKSAPNLLRSNLDHNQ